MQRRRVHGVMSDAAFNPRAVMDDEPQDYTKAMEITDTIPGPLELVGAWSKLDTRRDEVRAGCRKVVTNSNSSLHSAAPPGPGFSRRGIPPPHPRAGMVQGATSPCPIA